MNRISDYVSHAIQDELDSIMDIIYDDNIKKRLENIRDSIPCSCGEEEEMTDHVKCLCCGKDAIFDEYDGTPLNFCSQRCAESQVEWTE